MALLKVCGLTRFADVALCLRLGVTYLGAIVEIPRSPRCLSGEQARWLLRAARGKGVAVVEKPDLRHLPQLAQEAHLAAVQLHGDYRPEDIRTLRRLLPPGTEVWPVLGMFQHPPMAQAIIADLIETGLWYCDLGADKILIDPVVRGRSGGTGVTLEWEHARRVLCQLPVPVLIAGGIKPGNAAEALRVSGAAGVDASSGVEVRPGVKNPRAVADLMREVRGVGEPPEA